MTETATQLSRILCVEDEPDIQVIVRLALATVGGHQVETCSSGEEALAAALRFSPDIILLDVMMPGLDGPGTLRLLRADPRVSRTPIVFMTAKVQPEEVAEYLRLGALGVISKPFDPLTLAAELRGLWESHVAVR